MARARRKMGSGRHYEALRRENASLPDGMLAKLVNQKYAVVASILLPSFAIGQASPSRQGESATNRILWHFLAPLPAVHASPPILQPCLRVLLENDA